MLLCIEININNIDQTKKYIRSLKPESQALSAQRLA